MREPLSTISNIGFAVVAVLVWHISSPISIALLLLTFGSSFYHWKKSDRGAAADEIGMYAVLCMCLHHQTIQYTDLHSTSFLFFFGLFIIMALAYNRIDSFVGVPLLAFFNMLIFSLERPLLSWIFLGLFLALGSVRHVGQIVQPYNPRAHELLHGIVWHGGLAILVYHFVIRI